MHVEAPVHQKCEADGDGSPLHYARVFRFAPDAMLLLDPIAERIRDANLRACPLLGYACGELVRIAPRALHAHELDAFEQFLAHAREGGAPLSMRLRCRHASGRLVAVEASAARLDPEAGRSPLLLAILRESGARSLPPLAGPTISRNRQQRRRTVRRALLLIHRWGRSDHGRRSAHRRVDEQPWRGNLGGTCLIDLRNRWQPITRVLCLSQWPGACPSSPG